jgi:threonine dehydratase
VPQTSSQAHSILELIGGTPLVQLKRLPDEGAAEVWVKCEQFNPGGSVKDRIALAMIESAERDGRIRPGESVIVEPTSGNTGIGLALVCAVKGYHLILTMPESMSLERRSLLKAYGAELILTNAERTMEGAVDRAAELCKKYPHYYMPQQFQNPANPEVHRRTTARELLEQLGTRGCDAFVAGVGTGGTITGADVGGAVGRRRRAAQDSRHRRRVRAADLESQGDRRGAVRDGSRRVRDQGRAREEGRDAGRDLVGRERVRGAAGGARARARQARGDGHGRYG